LAEIDGYANFIFQIDKEKGQIYKDRVSKILLGHNYKEAHKAKFVKPIPKVSFFKKIVSFFKK
jgi:hypothetical protein